MKKFLSLAVAAMMAATASAQSTPLQLKGGWNNGFSGPSDVYSYHITKAWNGITANANGVAKADFPKFKVILAEPCPAGLQVIYDYKKSDNTVGNKYGAADIVGKTEAENSFIDEAVTITNIHIHPDVDCNIDIKIKAIQIIDNEGVSYDLPLKAGWECTDNTVYYTGTVSYGRQHQQIKFPGLEGKQDKKIKVELAKNATNVQMCVDYQNIIEGDRKSEWPQFNGGKQVIFTTNGGNPITSCGIQYTTPTPDEVEVKADVEVAGAWIIANATLTAVQDPKSPGNYYTTFFDGGTAYNIPSGVTAYKGVVEGNAVKLSEITGVIPRGEAVLLKSNSANITLTVNNNDGEKEANNELKGLEIAGNAPANCYIFSYAQNGLGFYHVDAGSDLAANKAYLVYEAPAGAKSFIGMNFDDSEVTGIENVQNDTADQTIYTLNGVRVAQPVRGLNIIGNKKYIVK